MTPVMNRIAGILLMPTSLSPEHLVKRRHYGKFLGTCKQTYFHIFSLGVSNWIWISDKTISREWPVDIRGPMGMQHISINLNLFQVGMTLIVDHSGRVHGRQKPTIKDVTVNREAL